MQQILEEVRQRDQVDGAEAKAADQGSPWIFETLAHKCQGGRFVVLPADYDTMVRSAYRIRQRPLDVRSSSTMW